MRPSAAARMIAPSASPESVRFSGRTAFSFIMAIVSPMIQLEASFARPQTAAARSNSSAIGFSSVKIRASYSGRPNFR